MSNFFIDNGFGGKDERAMQEQFEELCGGINRATHLMNLWNRCHPTGMKGSRYFHTKREVFINTAIKNGFTQEQVDCFLSL